MFYILFLGDYELDQNTTIKSDGSAKTLTLIGVNYVFGGSNFKESFPMSVTTNSSSSADFKMNFEHLVFENINIITTDIHINIVDCAFINKTSMDIKWYRKTSGFVIMQSSSWIGNNESTFRITGDNQIIEFTDVRIQGTSIPIESKHRADLFISNLPWHM